MESLLIKNFLSPGDIVMLTAAVRDLHRSYPDRFTTDVRTSCPALWENNPYLTPLDEEDPEVRVLEAHYPLIHKSNQHPYHFIHGFVQHFNEQLNLQVRPTAFCGDIHLSGEERDAPSQVEELLGEDIPFWIVGAGGKYDYTIKWWNRRRYQEVIDHFRDRVTFVQVGQEGHYHPSLKHVVDLRGKTDLRGLVRLMHHARGVLCGVTLHMHLAPAVPCRADAPKSRPAVVVAGGREPAHWEAYPTHQFLHTIGALPCCQTGGCWKARTVPLGDGDKKDEPKNLCKDVSPNGLPHCMDLITTERVIQAIELYHSSPTIINQTKYQKNDKSENRPDPRPTTQIRS